MVAKACNSQAWMTEAPVILVISGDYKRSEVKNGDKAPLYTHIEAGLIAQNIFLEAEALGLGAGIAGGMNDKALGQALKLPPANIPFLVMPVGINNRAPREKARKGGGGDPAADPTRVLLPGAASAGEGLRPIFSRPGGYRCTAPWPPAGRPGAPRIRRGRWCGPVWQCGPRRSLRPLSPPPGS